MSFEITTIDRYIEDGIKDRIIDFTVNGNCSNCGQCCNGILNMNKDEINKIRKYVKKHRIKEEKRFTILAKEKNILDMTCPFRDNKNKICKIYDVRPKACRMFICNKEKESKHFRDELTRTRKVVYLRKEFFGSNIKND